MKDVDELCVNTIRKLSADAVQKTNSGHAGAGLPQMIIAKPLNGTAHFFGLFDGEGQRPCSSREI